MKKVLAILDHCRRVAEGALGRFIAAISKGVDRNPNADTVGKRRTLTEGDSESSVPTGVVRGSSEDSRTVAQASSHETSEAKNSESSLGTASVRGSDPSFIHGTAEKGAGEHNTFSQLSNPTLSIPTSPQNDTSRIQQSIRSDNNALGADESGSRFRAPSIAPSAGGNPDFITRHELKRELDLLRRLMESRK